MVTSLKPKNIPETLQQFDHWLVWRYEDNPKKPKGKPLKVPYYVNGRKRSGVLGSDPDVENLASFEHALRVADTKGYSGIGLAILPQQNITVLDLDNCIDSEGTISEFGQMIIASGTYVERSPSGHGLRAVYLGAIAPDEKRNFHIFNGERVEIYCGKAYTTFTGDEILDRNEPTRTKQIIHLPRRIERDLEEGMNAVYRHRERTGGDGGGVASMAAIGLPNFTLDQARAVLKKLPARWGKPGEGTWYRVAAALHMQFDGSDEAYEVLDEWSQTLDGYDSEANARRWDAGFGHAHGKEDLTSVRNLVFEALSNGCKIRDKTMEAWRLKRPRNSTGVDDEEAEAETIEWELFDAKAFVNAETRPSGAEPLVRNWIYRRTVALFSSGGGAGKTYVALTFAVFLATGHEWFGVKTTRNRVLYVCAEDELDEIAHRLWGICMKYDIDKGSLLKRLDIYSMVKVPRKALYIGDNYGKAEFTAQFDRLKKALIEGKYDLLLLDNLSKLYMANENARPMADEFVSGLAILANTHNLGVVLLSHDAKNNAGYSGSTAWNNSVRTRWSLRINEKTSYRELIVEKNNYGQANHGGTWVWDDEAGVFSANDLINAAPTGTATHEFQREAVRVAILELYSQYRWVSAGTRGRNTGVVGVQEATGSDIDSRAVRTYLMELVEMGYLGIESYRDDNRKAKQRYCPPDPIGE